MNQFKIISGQWSDLEKHAKLIRTAVFIQEQNIDEADEWDVQDPISIHFIVYDQNQAIATARLLQNNHIGRVAVLKSYRGRGIGLMLMQVIIQQAQLENRSELELSAQSYASSFYEKLGFYVIGSEYLDCGIAHVDMYRKL